MQYKSTKLRHETLATLLFLVSCYWAVPFIRPSIGVSAHFGLPEITSVWLLISLYRSRLMLSRGRISVNCLLIVLMVWISFVSGILYLGINHSLGFVFLSSIKMSIWMLILYRLHRVEWDPIRVRKILMFVYVSFIVPVLFAFLEWRGLFALKFFDMYPAITSPRIHSTVGLTNMNMGIMCAINLFIGIWLVATEKKKYYSLAYTSLAVLYLFTLILVRHRTGMIMFVLFGTSFVLSFLYHRRKIFGWLMVGAAIGAIFLLNNPSITIMFTNNINSTINLLSERSQLEISTFDHRVFMWQANMGWLLNNPLLFFFGAGVGSWKFVLPYGSGAHNQYLHVVGELGLLGWLIYHLLFFHYFNGVYRIKRANSYSALCSHLLFFVLACLIFQESLWVQFACGSFPLFQYTIIAIVYSVSVQRKSTFAGQYAT